MNRIILILAIEFTVLFSFAFFIYRIVQKDIKRYRRGEYLPLEQ